MKTNSTKNWMKVAGLTLAIGTFAFSANAQTTTPDGTAAPKQAGPTALGSSTLTTAATPAADAFTAPTPGATASNQGGGYVRVIDNKGTIKFLQVQNGLTQVTNTTPAGGIVTTWQLGGQFVNDTKFDLNGHMFQLDNVIQVNPSAADGSGVPATTFATAATAANKGWALLVRDEATGQVKKLAAADLIISGQTYFTVDAASAASKTFNVSATPATPTLSGSKIPLPDFSKVWVFRNGAKLIANLDYTVSGSTVTLVPNSNAAANQDFALYVGDVIEIQYIK